MRIDGSERQITRRRTVAPAASDIQPADGTGSVGGSDSVPALDSVVVTGSCEATHVDGGAAARPVGIVPPRAVEIVPLAVGSDLIFPDPFPATATTLPGTAGSPVISLLDGGENAAAIASLRAGPVAASIPPGGLDNAEPVPRDDAAGSRPGFGLEAREVTWTDPASVDSAAVLAIGAATLVLSDLASPKGGAAAR